MADAPNASPNAEAPPPDSQRRASPWRALNARVAIGGVVILAFVLIAALAPVLAPRDPLAQDFLSFYAQPFWMDQAMAEYALGTDSLGRDILSRLIYGARTALIVAVIAAGAAAIIGTFLGLVAGFFGGWTDMLVSRAIEIWMSFPPVLLSIVLVAVMGAGLHSVIIAIAVIDWTRFARVVRSETMVQREQDYIASARTIGMGRWATLWREVLPNVLPLLITLFTLEMGIAVIVEAILGFVGLSVASDSPTWGNMISEGRQNINQAWWLMGFPTLAIIVVVLALNTMGDGLRTLLDPVMRR